MDEINNNIRINYLSNINILHIISNPGLGGAQSIVKCLIGSQKNHFVYSLKKSKDNCFSNLGNKSFYYNSYKNFKFNPFIILDLYKIIKKNNFKILHIHLVKSLIYASVIKLILPKLKIIYHEHGLIIASDKTNKPSNSYIWTLKLLNKKINKFIMISKYIYDLYINKLKIDKNKLELLYNFISISDTDKLGNNDINKLRRKLNITSKHFVVGFAGRLVERKGWKEFLYSAQELIKQNSKFKFLIAGVGPDKEKLLSFIQKNELDKNIIYLGFVKNMNNFYSILDCFCMPSHWEPMGLTHLEAQKMRTPIIVTNVHCLDETVSNENCIFIQKNNSKELSSKILTLTNHKLHYKLTEKGFKNANKYSLDIYIKKLIKIYKNA